MKTPIIITGHPRSGTTLLAGHLNAHPEVGPKPFAALAGRGSLHDFLDKEGFGPMTAYQRELERHDVWRTVFPTSGGFRDLQKVLPCYHSLGADPDDILRQMFPALDEQLRPLIKSPELLFALPALRSFPGSGAILICLREPVGTFASVWHYGMYSAPPIDAFRLESAMGIELYARRYRGMLEAVQDAATLYPAGTVGVVPFHALMNAPEVALRSAAIRVGLDYGQMPAPAFAARPVDHARRRLGDALFERVTAALEEEQDLYESVTGCWGIA